MSRVLTILHWVVCVVVLAEANNAGADVQVFVNRYLDWLIASQAQIRWIDFETLPNGQPSAAGIPIPYPLNYGTQGADFQPGVEGTLDFFGITGNPSARHHLTARANFFWERAWIIAEPVRPTRSVGVFFSGTQLTSVFDRSGGLLASQLYSAPGGGHFVGFVSDVPIGRLVADGGYASAIDAFVFDPIPEPASVLLLAMAGAIVFCRPRWRLCNGCKQ